METRSASVVGAFGVVLSGLLAGASCHRGVTPPRAVRGDAPAAVAPTPAASTPAAPTPAAPTPTCLAALRATLRENFLEPHPPFTPPPGGWTVATLDAQWTRHPNGYGFAAQALALPFPADAIPMLRAKLAHPNDLTALEAAAVLALLDDRSGVARLREVGVVTQSGVEFFYARAALTLLGEPIPASLAARRCAIPALERALSCR